jgi:glucosamine-6-phosphate deaminase
MVEKSDSKVEQLALRASGRKFCYSPTEKINVIEVENFPFLGKFTALRFLEWVQQNPGGVIALPTGKTPEHFIKWVIYYLKNWNETVVRDDMIKNGLDPSIKPKMKSLSFVQIDEFFPIDPQQHNSFYYYVNKFYIDGFSLDPEKAMLIDCWEMGTPQGKNLHYVFQDGIVDLTLRTRQPGNTNERMQKKVIETVDQFCTEYEQKIREMGGIGFFLGGIGPDGHIAFNVQGSDFYSTTRLTPSNYETQATAAVDLGGIEIARNRLVITIGLQTITFNEQAVAIIIAAGEAKASIVSQAIQNEKSNSYPATVLQKLHSARFYVTRGSAKLLVEREYEDLQKSDSITYEETEKLIINLALEKKKRIQDLSVSDLKSNQFTSLLLEKKNGNHRDIIKTVEENLKQKINNGLEDIENKVFMHTAPHHDDIMLGYLPYVYHLVRTPLNSHSFNYMTSGFTAVTNKYILNQLEIVLKFIDTSEFKKLMEEDYFNPKNESGRNRDVYQYLDGVAMRSRTMKDEAASRRLLRNFITILEEDSIQYLKDRIHEMISYFRKQYPGKKDLPYIQQLKGMIREWEADLLWSYFGFSTSSVNHLRLGFYKGDIFTDEPEFDRDVKPILKLLKKIRPDIVIVAFDPEGSGPDTHYKVMQAISEALKRYEQETGHHDIEIWGYRNVWYRFHPSEANILVPVSLNSISILNSAFRYCFSSQQDASFPSYEYDGPFSSLAQKIQSEQFQSIKICLGRQYFNENPHPRIRATHGLCFLRKMKLEEFYERTQELQKKMEEQD